MIYFYDKDFRYIGARELKDSEIAPTNSTTIQPILTVGKQAHFIDGAWVISDIPVEPIIEVASEPSTEEVLADLITTLADKGVL